MPIKDRRGLKATNAVKDQFEQVEHIVSESEEATLKKNLSNLNSKR